MKIHHLYLIIIGLTMLSYGCLHSSSSSVHILAWEDLAAVHFTSEYNDSLESEVSVAKFEKSIQKFNKQTVSITGYVINLGEDDYFLSANPYAACFFCGNAGPETVIELHFKEKPSKYLTDSWHSFNGQLVLYESDPSHLPYALFEVEEIVE